jgi:urocanate hydratase
MVMNNLDARVAQFPHELITYGGNGSVLSNWAQYHVLMHYLSRITDSQTLSMYSGHPMGLFPAPRMAPRVLISNGQMIPAFSTPAEYDRLYATGNTIYGQMTAGSWVYIGPQGIVHGTTITIANAGRKYLSAPAGGDAAPASNVLAGRVYVSSGLGGMSGAQGRAGRICGCVTVIAEVDRRALEKRLNQGWLDEAWEELDRVVTRVRECRALKAGVAIGYLGNVVDLWERLAREPELLVDLGSDQTSLHNPFNGGYFPVGLVAPHAGTAAVD